MARISYSHFRDVSLAEKGQAALRRPMTACLDMTPQHTTHDHDHPFSTAFKPLPCVNQIIQKSTYAHQRLTSDIWHPGECSPTIKPRSRSTNHTRPHLLAPISPWLMSTLAYKIERFEGEKMSCISPDETNTSGICLMRIMPAIPFPPPFLMKKQKIEIWHPSHAVWSETSNVESKAQHASLPFLRIS